MARRWSGTHLRSNQESDTHPSRARKALHAVEVLGDILLLVTYGTERCSDSGNFPDECYTRLMADEEIKMVIPDPEAGPRTHVG